MPDAWGYQFWKTGSEGRGSCLVGKIVTAVVGILHLGARRMHKGKCLFLSRWKLAQSLGDNQK